MAGYLNIESPIPGNITPALAETLRQSGIIDRIAEALTELPSIEQRLDALIDTESSKLGSVYPQILNLAIDIVGKPNLSGAIILLRDRSENLAQVIDLANWMTIRVGSSSRHAMVPIAPTSPTGA